MDENRIDVATDMTTSKSMAGKAKRAVRVGELEALRTANRKIFRMDDGSEQAVFCSGMTREGSDAGSPLELDTDGKHYRKHTGSFNAAFSCDKTNDELFSMERDAHRITISTVKNNIHRNSGKVPMMHNKALLFENVTENTDMEYSVVSGGVKENIVVKQQANAYRYPFIIHCENVSAEADSSAKQVKFVSAETGEEVFFIPAPFMVDANGIVSTAVIYELESLSDGDIQLTVVADSDWINAQDRAFPVTIDPQVMVSGSANIVTYSWTDGIMTAPAEHAIGKASGTTNRMYLHFNMPTLPNNPRIKKAELAFYQKSSINNNNHAPKLGLFQVTKDITTGTTTPAQSNRLIDFETLKIAADDSADMISYHYDITRLIDAVHNGESSYQNLVLEMMETPSNDSSITLYGSTDANYAPTICVTYESSYGVNTSYRTHTHELGRFGQGSIDLACGNLMFECQDFGWSGNRMPVTLKRLYTSALAAHPYTHNSSIKLETADFSAMKLGYGWKLNIMQSMISASFQHEGTPHVGYVYIGENGDEVYFKLREAQNDSLVNPEPTQYEAVDDSSMIYTPETGILEQGGEKYMFDASGRLISITDEYNNCMSITYVDNRITCVTDGAGRNFTFAYDSNGQLVSITAPDASIIRYSYANNRLSGVTYPDGSGATVSYNADSAVLTVTMCDASHAPMGAVEYYFNGTRVRIAAEYGVENGSLVLGKRSYYTYSASTHATSVQSVEDADPAEGESVSNKIVTVYTFDGDGEVINEYAYSQVADKTGIAGTGAGIHPYYGDGGVNTIGTSRNLLLNQNFDNSTYWNTTEENDDVFSCSRQHNEAEAKYGNSVLVIQSHTDQCQAQGLQQTVAADRAGEYTFSAYLRLPYPKNGDAPSAYIRVIDSSGNVLAESEHISTEDDYIRVSTSFVLASPQNVTAQILLDGKGTVYADVAQLEYGACASDYNMILNGSFSNTDDWNWVKTEGVRYDDSASFWGPNAIQITGNLEEARNVGQVVPVCQKRSTRETFTLSGWAKGTSVPVREREDAPTPTFRLRAVVHYADSDYDDFSEETFTADFSAHTDAWHYASVEFAKSKYRRIQNIEVFCDYDYNSGTASFDDIQLVRSGIETGLSSEDFPMTEAEDIPDAAVDTSAASIYSAPEFAELQDLFGNALTETTFTDGEFGTIYRSFDYDENGNNLIRETDARGNMTVYTVDPATSRNTMVTDRCGNKTLYEYDVQGRTSKVTSKNNEDAELANVSYAYDAFDNLTEIHRGDGLKYVLRYNQYHNLESIGVDGKEEKLVHYTYKTGNGRLKQVTYANGDYMKAVYNNLGQMIAEKWYNVSNTLTAHYKYTYDCQGNIVRSVDILACKEYNYYYEDGMLLRSAEFDITVNAEDIVTSKCLVSEVRYSYDADGQLIRKRIIPVSGAEQVIYYEADEGKNAVVKFTAGGNTVTSHSKNDSFGRKVFDELQLGSGYVSRQFLYYAGQATQTHEDNAKLKSTPTTNLVSKIILSDGHTLSYEYDEEERITKVIDSYYGTTEYTYDALGQLLTEKVNDRLVNTMTYDNYGNILSKNGKTYTYGDGIWKDKLTSYDGQPIIYDAQGNPTTYLGHTLTWEKGRQLKSFDGNTYTYNANGIRTSKTVNGVKHTYTLDGTKILRETWGDNVLIPLYDNEDSVCGIIYNDIPYYFLKNLQGDVIAITDKDGQVVAEYAYDAWGTCFVADDMSIGNIEDINPFRYRGYYYDTEIGMYYLQSRYYNPVVGVFLNSDLWHYLGSTESSASYNLFTYCCNSPVTNWDPLGLFLITIAGVTISAATLALYLMYLACAMLLVYYLEKLIRLLSKTISNLIEDLFETIEYSVQKALKKKQQKSTHKHHIIAQTASRAATARNIWKNKMKLSINDSRNLVVVNSVFHSFLHQTAYYATVNELVNYGYNKKGGTGVLMVVATIKGILSTMNSWYF